MQKKKKILLAVTKGNWGGAQRYVFDLATNIPKSTFETVVLCGEGERLVKKLKEKTIRVVRLESLGRNMSFLKDVKTFIDLIKVLRRERPDVLHLNSSKIGGIGAVAGRLTGVPQIIFTGHGWAWNEDRNPISKFFITCAHWSTVILCDKVIAVSEKIAKEIERLPLINTSKIVVIHNGINDIEYAERFAARAVLNDRISEKFWVGTIAELHKNKGVDTLIRAFVNVSKKHTNTALLVIGEGEERNNLTRLIEELNLSKKVHLLGFVDEARKFLKAFDVFVLASRTEAFPYVPLEAGLAQLPMIATRVGGIPELISDEKNGLLIDVNDTETLTEKIENLLENSTKATVLGHNLRKTVEQHFSTDSMVQKTLSVYNRMSKL